MAHPYELTVYFLKEHKMLDSFSLRYAFDTSSLRNFPLNHQRTVCHLFDLFRLHLAMMQGDGDFDFIQYIERWATAETIRAEIDGDIGGDVFFQRHPATAQTQVTARAMHHTAFVGDDARDVLIVNMHGVD